MKKTFLITAILMLSAVWAVAQTSPSTPQSTTPGAASSPSSTMPTQSTTPDASAPATQSSPISTDSSTAIEGCLSGSSGSYTLTDQSGKAWTLAGDTSKLTEHVGHQIRVMGSGSDAGSSAASGSSPSSSGASASGSTFTVKKIKMISSSCSTSK
jgi:hypothetical protein